MTTQFFKYVLRHINFLHQLKSEYPVKIATVLVLIGLIFSLFVIGNRIYFESKNKFVDILVGYEDWKNIEELRNSGVTIISIPIDSLKLFEKEGRLTVVSGGELENIKVLYRKFESIKSSLNKTYIFSADEKLLNRLKNILSERFKCAYNLRKDINCLEINADRNEIYDLGIGFDSEKIKDIIKIGYKVVLRFKPDRLADEIWTKLIFESIDDWNNVFGVLFEEDEVFGFGSTSTDVLKTLLKKTNARILSVEFAKVKGIDLFQRELTGRVLRTHFIEKDRLKNISFYDAVYRFRRAVVERNIRVIYIQPLPVSVEENIKFIKKVKEELENRGYKILKGDYLQMGLSPYFAVSPIITFIIAVSIISICLLIIPGKFILMLFLFSVLIIILLILNQTIFVQKFISFLGTIFLPVIAVSFIGTVPREDFGDWDCPDHSGTIVGALPIILDTFIRFAKITLITLIGSMFISSLLSTEVFTKAIVSFSGVKLANLLPFIFICYYFYVSDREKMDIILNKTMKVKHLICISVLIVIFAISLVFFISRTDNFGKVIFGEDKIRLFLENSLIARPRLKEFLMGHPILILGIAIYYHARDKNLKLTSLLLITFGMIGQISIINTFCHIHTPFVFSIFRTLNGILISSILGILLILGTHFIIIKTKHGK